MSFTEEDNASIARIIKKVGRQYTRPTAAYDEEHFSIFDEQPTRWSREEVDAWKEFENCNLKQTGKIHMPAVLNEVVKYQGKPLTLFFETRKTGTVQSLSAKYPSGKPKPCYERELGENLPLFEGAYTGHHPDERVMLVKGYNSTKYYEFIQNILESYLSLEANTLVRKTVVDYGELVPLCMRLIWPERKISFYVECEDKLYDMPAKDTGCFSFYARWIIMSTTTQEFHWE
jgi:hypothetical protein